MKALGFEMKKVDIMTILKDFDREGTGKITYENFKEVGRSLKFHLALKYFMLSFPFCFFFLLPLDKQFENDFR